MKLIVNKKSFDAQIAYVKDKISRSESMHEIKKHELEELNSLYEMGRDFDDMRYPSEHMIMIDGYSIQGLLKYYNKLAAETDPRKDYQDIYNYNARSGQLEWLLTVAEHVQEEYTQAKLEECPIGGEGIC